MAAVEARPVGGDEQDGWEELRLASVSRRRWRWALAGVVLIAGGAAAGLGAVALGEQAVPVAVAARDVPAGHVLGDGDVQVVQMPAEAAAGFVELSDAVGEVAALPLAEGSVLVPGVLGDGAAWPDAGRAVMAVELPAGAVPEGVGPGAAASLVPGGGSAEEGAALPGEGIAALVHAVRDSDELGGGHRVVEVEVAQADAALVARGGGDVRLVLLGEAPPAGAQSPAEGAAGDDEDEASGQDGGGEDGAEGDADGDGDDGDEAEDGSDG